MTEFALRRESSADRTVRAPLEFASPLDVAAGTDSENPRESFLFGSGGHASVFCAAKGPSLPLLGRTNSAVSPEVSKRGSPISSASVFWFAPGSSTEAAPSRAKTIIVVSVEPSSAGNSAGDASCRVFLPSSRGRSVSAAASAGGRITVDSADASVQSAEADSRSDSSRGRQAMIVQLGDDCAARRALPDMRTKQLRFAHVRLRVEIQT